MVSKKNRKKIRNREAVPVDLFDDSDEMTSVGTDVRYAGPLSDVEAYDAYVNAMAARGEKMPTWAELTPQNRSKWAETAAIIRDVAKQLDEKASKRFGFDEAIRMLKEGCRVAREGWNGKGMWIFICHPSLPEIEATHGRPATVTEDARASTMMNSVIAMKTATGDIVVGWLASQTDMLAEDWVEVIA